ncbi:MAG: hypothetical protein J6S67_21675 [Methanobrevibacter sp.]|nr:hypothetical protein [Methanobrevibacter sp.]
MIDLEKMAEAHKRLFPNATLESQVWKLEEEIREYIEAVYDNDLKQEIKESADVVIVCGGLARWCPMVAEYIKGIFFDSVDVEKEVARKWQINLKRKWVWNGKTYHHEGKDNV